MRLHTRFRHAFQRHDQDTRRFVQGSGEDVQQHHTKYRGRGLEGKLAGLHDCEQGHGDDGDSLHPLARNLGVNGGVQKRDTIFSLPMSSAHSGRPHKARLLPPNLRGRSLTTPYLPSTSFSLGRGLDTYWQWFGGRDP